MRPAPGPTGTVQSSGAAEGWTMHKQIRVRPTASPPDLERLLRFLKDEPVSGDEAEDGVARDGVNIVAVGGGDVELGEEFVFAVQEGHEAAAARALEKGGYHPTFLSADDGDFALHWLTNEPGQLHAAVASVASENLERGKVIKDIAIGVPENGKVPVQIYSIDIRTEATVESAS
jgi:hypothetical protein